MGLGLRQGGVSIWVDAWQYNWKGAREAAENVFTRAAGKRDFGNARFEQAYGRMAARAAHDGAVTVEELTTLLPEDIDEDLSMLAKERPRIGF